MKNEDPEIIKTLRQEERLGKLHAHSPGKHTIIIPKELEEEPIDSIFTILRHRKDEDIETIDLGDPIQKYRIIFDNSALAIMLTDENERIVHWNKYTEKLLRMSREDLIMRPVKYLYPQEEWKKIRSENIRQKGIQYHMETKMIRNDNELIDVDISLSVLKDHIGNVIGSIGIVKDNSQNKQMEKALRTSEEKFKQLYEKAPIPYHTLSPAGTITDVNEKWCKLFGYTKEEVIGNPIFDYIHGDEQEIAKSSFKEKINSKKAYTDGHERTFITKNGEPRVFLIHDFLSFNETGGMLSVFSTMEDVTGRKKIEEELHKAHYWLGKNVQERTVDLSKENLVLKKRNNEYKRTIGELHIQLEKIQKAQKKIEQQNARLKKLDHIKSNFLNVTSHELRTSMATIKGYVEIILMKSLGPITEEQRKGLDVILTNTDRLDQLIQDTLDVSRLESGTMKFIPEKTDIGRLIQNATGTIQSAADFKQIKIIKEIEEEIPELNIDQERIKQVLVNLLQNAISVSPEGSKISVKVNKEPEEVLFEIQDFGQGIPKNKQKKIFDIVYQIDSGIDDLGFTIARGVVLAHGGKIWVDSEQGHGSTFRFTLPITPIQDQDGKNQKS
ncbi:MAG: PAS domain-containing sensor histidine kinase [Euryarchaeota archaeon]|jgi:PAS domain S-box-containing protein|nr:PAS domain-containing sensor histidine kinase [Euryarchaeota archaeon]